MQEDSIDGIYRTLRQCALISKHAGGIGLSMQAIRAKGINLFIYTCILSIIYSLYENIYLIRIYR